MLSGSQKMSVWNLRAEKKLGYETAVLKSTNHDVKQARTHMQLFLPRGGVHFKLERSLGYQSLKYDIETILISDIDDK